MFIQFTTYVEKNFTVKKITNDFYFYIAIRNHSLNSIKFLKKFTLKSL